MDQLLVEVETKEIEQAVNEARQAIGDKEVAKAVRAAFRQAAKEFRSMLRGANAPERVAKAAARSLGYKVRTQRRELTEAKFGLGVGSRRGAGKQAKKRKRPGVGLGRGNIHWAVLGTGQRSTKTGKNRGRMPGFLMGVIDSAKPIIAARIHRELLEAINKAVQQAAAKGKR